MKKSVFFYKELTPAEVGNTGTHEIYVRLPNNFDHEAFFGNKATENGSVLEINFTAFDTTDSNFNSVNLRFVYFINSNQEKRIPGLGEIFKLHNVQEGDIVCIESREDNSQTSFYIHFYKKGSITIYPSSVFFMRIGEEMLTNPKSIFSSLPLQQIYYGAPGTGKSFEINLLTKDKEVIRTTFHPDSDYSTFVGAYKPTSIEIPVRDVTGKVIVENGKQVTENRIVYEFVEQAFLQAYTKAWKAYAETAAGEYAKEQFLVIEEINRGNCAQIFGDLFQLLDRNRYGFSDYPITADKDMKKPLAKAFKDLTIADADRINKIYDKDIVSQVLNGEVLLLPDNLYIWATMNTSDQSLFPIDSAFKRRWDWKYMKIRNHPEENYKIKLADTEYDWWEFIQRINEIIASMTSSADKQLGYFFCKAAGDGTISPETFVSKVIFYLWNDVFKDYGFEDESLFSYKEIVDGKEETKELTFPDFYDEDGEKVNEVRLKDFLDSVMNWKKDEESKR